MADLTSQHGQAKRLILVLREGLERLENAEGGRLRADPSGVAKELRQQWSILQRLSAEMDGAWRMATVRDHHAKRDVWKRKVEQVAEETDSIRLALEKYGQREERRTAERREREELFSRASEGLRAKREMDEESQAMSSIQRSKNYLEEIYESGTHILVNMAGNRERLKRAHKKVLDVLNTVGLGESLIRLIERRQRFEIWITYGCMVLLLAITILLLWWRWF